MPDAAPCLHCGRVPTAEVDLRANTGMLVAARWSALKGPLCKQCGLALFRQRMNHTLLLGWWGVVAFFLNFHAVYKNLVSWQRLRAIHDPWGAPTQPPLDPGRPVFARPGMGVVAALCIAIAFLVPATSSDESAADLAGRCVNVMRDGLDMVDCDEIHDGQVLRMASDTSQCPDGSDDAIRLRRPVNPIVCLDLDR